jgi:transcriptional regulator NrdR family protein
MPKKASSSDTTKTKVKVINDVQTSSPNINPAMNPPDPEPQGKSIIMPEIGMTGTYNFRGIINEDYNSQLSGRVAMRVYDEMARSDATVKQALLACTLPVRRANWYVEPASQDEKDLEIADFIKHALFEYQEITWDDILRQALLSFQYGVFLFEKVFDFKEVEGKEKIIWKKFAPRLPRSILQWQMGDGNAGIRQLLYTGPTVDIPMNKLIIFVHEKEGDNWWGISGLRSAYKHWYMKTQLEKIDAIAHERQGMGIPFIKMQDGYSDADQQQAVKILKNLRASENGYLIEPANITVDFKDMKAQNTKDAEAPIKYHNRQILVAVLAQFLELGNTSSGSRATSTDHSDLFLKSLESMANNIAGTFNKCAIKELVDLNYDGVIEYPTLKYNGVAKEDINTLSTALQRLGQAGMIKPNDRDEQYLREMLGFPEMDQDDDGEIDDEPIDKDAADVAEDLGVTKEVKKKVNSEKIELAIMRRMSNMDTKDQIEFLKDRLAKLSKMPDNKDIFAETVKVMSAKLSDLQRLMFRETNEFKGWREMTFAEKKVNFNSIQDFINSAEDRLSTQGKKMLTSATDEFIKKLTKALHNNDKKAIVDLEVKFHNDYKGLLKAEFKKAYEFGKNAASREMGLETPANSAEMLRNIDIAADTIATTHGAKIESATKHTIIDQLNKSASVAVSMGAADQEAKKVINKVINDMSTTMVGGYVNDGRGTAFDKYANKIYALQRSELLDNKTCDYCLSMDGRVIPIDDPMAREGSFHSSCRGIWVEIMKDEQEKPEIDGIPDSLRNAHGGKVNDIKQPDELIVKPGGDAEEYLNK